MPPRRGHRVGATNTHASGQVNLVRLVVPVRLPAPAPVVVTRDVVPIEVSAQNAGALHALQPEDNLNQVPAIYLISQLNKSIMHSYKDLELEKNFQFNLKDRKKDRWCRPGTLTCVFTHSHHTLFLHKLIDQKFVWLKVVNCALWNITDKSLCCPVGQGH